MAYWYHSCRHHSGGQIENSTVKEITPREEEAPNGPETPAVTEQSLKGVGKGGESPGALYIQEGPHAGQRHHQDKT